MTMKDESEAMDAVRKALARRSGPNEIELTLTNGIVLKCRPVPMAISNAVKAELDRSAPAVPTTWIEEKGRDEENPNDPAYLRQVEEHDKRVDLALQDLYTAAGTEVVSWPEHLYGPDDDAWLQDPRVVAAANFGLPIHLDTPTSRKVAYVRYYALETYVDSVLHSNFSLQVQGIREEDVAEAIAGFRSAEERDADRGAPSEAGDQHGDRPNRPTRRASARNRSA